MAEEAVEGLAVDEKISHKHMRVLDHYYSNGLNKAKALAAEGYKLSCQRSPGVVFALTAVKKEMARREELSRRKYDLTEAWVIERLMVIADSGRVLSKFKKVTASGKLTWDFTDATPEDLEAINELTTETVTTLDEAGQKKTTFKFKVGTSDAKGALDSLARRLNLFKDTVVHEGTISLAERLQKGRDRARAKSP